jgi:hypothetical protein
MLTHSIEISSTGTQYLSAFPISVRQTYGATAAPLADARCGRLCRDDAGAAGKRLAFEDAAWALELLNRVESRSRIPRDKRDVGAEAVSRRTFYLMPAGDLPLYIPVLRAAADRRSAPAPGR